MLFKKTVKQSGNIVHTPHGKGRTFDKELPVNGKYPVYMLDDDLRPKTDENGKPVKMLIKSTNIEIIGYID